ncbi:MAG: transcription elongation factor GreA [Chloroflexi bacterium]|nr:transcription elongation factor GreA [Chloroflexota bacterium]
MERLNEEEPVVYLTREGYEKLKERLEYLINVRRPEIAQQIHDAKEMGDISENAGYDEAKNAQAFLEGEIAELEWKLKHAVIIEEDRPGDTVALGAQVTVVDEASGEEETYTIVGSAEADPFEGRISNESPVGKALMGHKVGEVVEAHTPGGILRMRITKIQ